MTEETPSVISEETATESEPGDAPLEVTVDDVTWRTSVFPQKNGGYVLPVKADVRRRANIAAGDEVTVKLELL